MHSLVRLGRVCRLTLDAGTVACREVGNRVDDAAADPTAAAADGDHDRRLVACPDDDVLGATGAMEEIPGRQPALLPFDDQQALTGQHEKALLGVLPVVHAGRLAGLENADVDPQLRESALAVEGAVGTERAFVAPTRLASVHDEPPFAVDNETVLAHPQRGLGGLLEDGYDALSDERFSVVAADSGLALVSRSRSPSSSCCRARRASSDALPRS